MQTARKLDGDRSSAGGQGLRVLNIQRSCVHDGPGIRTVLFFAGCNLRCLWCQNPEAISFPAGASLDAPASVDEIVRVVLKDRAYFANTGGGVTLSGGEPLLQRPADLVPLLKRMKDADLHIAVETSGHAPWRNVETVLPYVDLFLVDLKVVGDDERHLELTKQKGALIHGNIQKLHARSAPMRFRMVVVPGCNDSDRHLEGAADFLKSLGHDSIELLKYHSMYEAKRRRLGLRQGALKISNDESLAAVRRASAFLGAAGIDAPCIELSSSEPRPLFSERVYDLQNDIRESDTHLCLESAALKTAFYRENGFDGPTPLHRARSLAYLLKHKEVIIYPGERIVGNFTAKRVGGNCWVEYFGIAMVSIMHQIHRQTPVPFKCTWGDRLRFYTDVFPFWARHSLLAHVHSSLFDWSLDLARLSELKVGFNNNTAAIAHFIVNHDRMLALGTSGLIEEVRRKQAEAAPADNAFHRGAIIALEALETFAARYADALEGMAERETDADRRGELERMVEVCRRVPRYSARTFHEALQSILFLQIALCTESFENAISFGRLDQILYPYFKRDQEAGILTYEEAKDLLACFILKVDEVVLVNDGDSYFGIGRLFESLSTVQSVTFGGVDGQGRDATNDVTYMLLDVCELQPRGVNMTARIHRGSPRRYVERIAEVYLSGSPMPALYNDEIYVETLQKHYDTTVSDARNYGIVGCVEPVASNDHFGNTDCANLNVALPLLQALKGQTEDLWDVGWREHAAKMGAKLLHRQAQAGNRWTARIVRGVKRVHRIVGERTNRSACDPPRNMDELLGRFQVRLNRLAGSVLEGHQRIEAALREHFTTPLASSLYPGCLESGKDVYEGGTTLNSCGIQAVGITDVADSLCALDEVVFKQGRYGIEDVVAAIDANFEGERNERIRSALEHAPKFGDDAAPEPQYWVNKVLEMYVRALQSVPGCPREGIYTAGYYALNVNIVYGAKTPALPSGRMHGVPLAHSVAPHYGMQKLDLVSSLNAVAGVDFARYAPNGTTITFTIDAGLFLGEDGASNLAGLILSFFEQGGMQFQPNVIRRETLLEAYRHPEKHKHLLVRVAGYCAYFNDLSDELKLAIINRTCYA